MAHRGWARYLLNPRQHERLALQEIGEAARADPMVDEAHYFLGEIHRAAGRLREAEEAYRRALLASPEKREYADLIQSVQRQRKAA